VNVPLCCWHPSYRGRCRGRKYEVSNGVVDGLDQSQGLTHSIRWSATQSHMFSKYPDACGVMCIIKLAAPQAVLVPSVNAGHSAGLSSVPMAPPMRHGSLDGSC
jgi:hypothetical protein